MNILIISQYFWPENFRVNELVTELIHRGHEVTVLTGLPNYPQGQLYPEYKKKTAAFSHYQKAEVIRVPHLLRGNNHSLQLILNYLSFAFNATFLGAWKLRKHDIDIIITFEPSPITVGIPSAFLRWMKQAPQVFWVLDLWPETLKALGVINNPYLLKFLGYLVSFVYKHCDLILAQSHSFIDNIQQYTNEKKRIEYFPAWLEGAFETSSTSPAPELERQADKFTIVFTGNIAEAQDFPAILDTAEKLKHHKHIRWVIIGDGRQSEWVKQQVKQKALQDCFLLLGRYPLERMPDFFAHADALLVSLKDDPIFAMTIPGKLQSYLSAGKPILAMLNGEGADIVTSHDIGLACPANRPDQLAHNVLKLANMPTDKKQKMGNNAQQLAHTAFNKQQLINQLEKWLSELIAP